MRVAPRARMGRLAERARLMQRAAARQLNLR
jgi:hypothetical protein